MRPSLLILSAASALSLGACAYGGAYYGGSVGPAYVDAGFDPDVCWNYGFYGWSAWPGPVVPSYCGWYGGYFYPGFGVYVYDRDHHRIRWNDQQRSYWSQRAAAAPMPTTAAQTTSRMPAPPQIRMRSRAFAPLPRFGPMPRPRLRGG